MLTLVAGIGNVFLGDDAFGVEVVRRLGRRPLPEGVRVVDFGIRGFDLAHELMRGYERAILVDAMQRGGAPGTLYLIEPNVEEPDGAESAESPAEGHSLHPANVFRLVRALGGRLPELRLLGCEPASTDEDERMELSEPVDKAADEAVDMIHALIREQGRA